MTAQTPFSLKSASLLLGTLGAAAGLNLSVISLGVDSAGASEGTASGPMLSSGEPEVIQIEVNVPIPSETSDGGDVMAAAVGVGQADAAPPPSLTPASPPAAPAATTAPTVSTATAAAPNSTPSTAAASPTTAAAPPTTAPTTTQSTVPPATVPPATVPPTSTSATEYLYYSFNGVASEIVVAYHNGEALEFWSVTTEPGWAYQLEKDRANRVEIKFRRVSGGEGEAKFELIRENGELKVKKED